MNTSSAAADDDDDASQCDVIVPHPGHLLLINFGTCSSTKLVFSYHYCGFLLAIILVQWRCLVSEKCCMEFI